MKYMLKFVDVVFWRVNNWKLEVDSETFVFSDLWLSGSDFSLRAEFDSMQGPKTQTCLSAPEIYF